MPNLFKRIMLFKIFQSGNLNPEPKISKWRLIRNFIQGLAILFFFFIAFIVIENEYGNQFGGDNYLGENLKEENQIAEAGCNTRGIELYGDVVTYISPGDKDKNGNTRYYETGSIDIMSAIDEAEVDDKIKAIIMVVDSYGGVPVAAEEISEALKRTSKPTVALVRGAATSAAYWSSTGANIIFASALSDIGGIGVTTSYIDRSKKNTQEGFTYNSLSVGKFKDYLDKDKPLTAEERALVMRDLNIVHENFIKAVATNRNLDINKVRALSDGSSMPGQMAIENGLIDRIGGMAEVREYLGEIIGEEVNVCW